MSGKTEEQPKPPKREKKIADKITAKFGDNVVDLEIKPKRIKVKVKPKFIKETAEYFNKELDLDHVESVSGVDYPNDNEMEVVYHIGTYSQEKMRDLVITLAARIPRDEPKIQSLIDIWPGVEYDERETYEMLGIIFEGHPRLERLFLPEDWDDIPPLRKDFKNPGR